MCSMKHDLSRQHRNQRERRARRQEDKIITAVVAAIGGGDLDQWQDDVEGWRDEMGDDHGT